MTIAHFCASIESGKDGVARVLEEITRFTGSKNISSLFVTAVRAGRTDVCSIEVVSLPVPKYDGYRLSISTAGYIQRRMAELDCVPDIIHLHSPCTLGLAGISLARRFGIPVVATYHTHFPTYLQHHGFRFLDPLARAYLRYFYNRCDMVFVPSETLCEELRENGIRNVQFLPHGIDVSAFHKSFASPARRRAVLGDDEHTKTILLYVGRLVWEKNIRFMAEAVRPLLQTRKNVSLVVVGTGPAEAEVRAMLPEAHFLGFRAGCELSELYASSDVFVFPSDTETFGNVTLEALASGLPCVVADAGGSADLVQNGENGFKVSPRDVSAFRSAVAWLLDDAEARHRMAEKAFHSAQKSSWDGVLERMVMLYAHLLFFKKQCRVEAAHDTTCSACRYLPLCL